MTLKLTRNWPKTTEPTSVGSDAAASHACRLNTARGVLGLPLGGRVNTRKAKGGDGGGQNSSGTRSGI